MDEKDSNKTNQERIYETFVGFLESKNWQSAQEEIKFMKEYSEEEAKRMEVEYGEARELETDY